MFAAIVLIVGCGSPKTYELLVKDRTDDLYPTIGSVDEGDIVINAPVDNLEDRKIIYLISSARGHGREGLERVIEYVALDLGYQRVISQDQMLRILLNNGANVMLADLANKEVIKRLSDSYGPFLVMYVDFSYTGNMSHAFTLQINDPVADRVLFKVNSKKYILYSLSKEVIYPVVNEFVKWHKESTKN